MEEDIKKPLPNMIREAYLLLGKGDFEGAAELMSRYELSQLPEQHPSRSLTGAIEGERVSELYRFELRKEQLQERLKFLSVMMDLMKKPSGELVSGVCNYFLLERPELMEHFSTYLLKPEVQKAGQELGVHLPDIIKQG